MVHAPMLAAGPETELAGVWARRPEAAATLAATHGAGAFASFDELLDQCEAVAIAVAPDAQPALAIAAARAGRAVLLEKPVATDAVTARRVADAVGEAGVGSMVVLTYRYAADVRAFLAAAGGFGAEGGRAWWFSGAFLSDSPFAASPWRQEHGALLDVGPHVLDLVEAALGPVVGIIGRRGPNDWVGLILEHAGGQVSEVTMSCRAAIKDSRAGVDLYGPGGVREVDLRRARGTGSEVFATLRAEFATVARSGGPHPCDVHRGVVVQDLVDRAARAIS
jgi:predicted dehydrogenase